MTTTGYSDDVTKDRTGATDKIRLSGWTTLASFACLAAFLLGILPASAQEESVDDEAKEELPAGENRWTILRSPGLCSYVYDRFRSERTTSCSATAFVLNQVTSEVVRCDASLTGNQFTAPSLPENAPELVTCRNIGRVFNALGEYGIASIDDNTTEEKTKIRRKGHFVWSNAYWVYSQSGPLKISLCAGQKIVSNPDLGQRCSRKMEWPDK